VLYEDPHWHRKAELGDHELHALLNRWRGWAQPESIPLRTRFDPVDSPRLLPWIIFEVLSAPPAFDARVRYIGSEIVHYFNGQNCTGMRVSELEPVFARRWSDVGGEVVTARGPIFFEGRPFMVDKAFALFEMLALPFSKSGETVDFWFWRWRDPKRAPESAGYAGVRLSCAPCFF
jgi:hypothetical protein